MQTGVYIYIYIRMSFMNYGFFFFFFLKKDKNKIASIHNNMRILHKYSYTIITIPSQYIIVDYLIFLFKKREILYIFLLSIFLYL
jgi:hypothetical protein